MPALTAFILAALAGYCVAWYAGYIEGNFPLLLLVATVITGAYWLAERFFFLPRRRAAASALEARHDPRRAGRARHQPGGCRYQRGPRAPAVAALVAGLDGRAFPYYSGSFSSALLRF